MLSLLSSRLGLPVIVGATAFLTGLWIGYDYADDAAEVARLEAAVAALEAQAQLEATATQKAEQRAKEALSEAERLSRLKSRITTSKVPNADRVLPLIGDTLRGLRE